MGGHKYPKFNHKSRTSFEMKFCGQNNNFLCFCQLQPWPFDLILKNSYYLADPKKTTPFIIQFFNTMANFIFFFCHAIIYHFNFFCLLQFSRLVFVLKKLAMPIMTSWTFPNRWQTIIKNNIEINRIMKMKWNFFSSFVFEIIGYSNCLTFWPSFKGSMARMVSWGEKKKRNMLNHVSRKWPHWQEQTE